MLTFNSFLQTVFRFVKSLVATITKKVYRCASVLFAGAVVVVAITFTSNGFRGGGRNALAAYDHNGPGEDTGDEGLPELQSDETALFTEAKIPAIFTDSVSKKEGQLFVGSLLVKETNDRMANQTAMQEAIEQNQEAIRRVFEERALAAAEEAARQAQEQQRQAEEEARQAAAVIDYSDEDYRLLLRIVEAEAGGCDEKGRILVANVVINRVKDDEFPDTIHEVIYQPSQFSPVRDGRLNSVTVTDETKEAVERALSGEDYSDGALFFMNRRRAKSSNVSWFDGHLTYLFHHDNHDFFR